jgi:tRNA-2-methylthio-N6-dimethylallyladenosine synthase
VRAVGYAQAYSFSYSPRPGTPAATMDAQIPKAEMDARLQALQAEINKGQQAFNNASVGTRTKILLERRGKLADQFIGKSPWLQSVHIVGKDFSMGDVVDVDLVAAGPNSMTGAVAHEKPRPARAQARVI